MTMIRLGALVVLFGCLAAAHHAQAAEPQTLRIGTEAGYPPFEYRDSSGTLKGFDIDIGNELCAKMNAKCIWVVQDFDGLIPALQAGKVDAIISSMSVTSERAKAVDFTKPYYRSPSQFVALRSSGLNGDPGTLKGKVIGVQSGTIHQLFVEQKLPGSNEKVYDTLQDADLDLEAGRVDAVLADKLAMYDWLMKEGAAKGFDYAGKPLQDSTLPGDVAIAVVKGNDALHDQFDASIDEALADGTYDRISRQYFPFSIRPH